MTTRVPRWLPNALSALRIALVPVWLVLAIAERARALEGFEVRRLPLLAVLGVIGLTDVLDGQLARRFGLASHLGAVLDAVADKLATLTAVTFLAFFAAPAFTPLPLWLWAALLARDAALLIGYLTLRARRRPIDASHLWEGRVATLLLFTLVVSACAAAPARWVAAGALGICALVAAGTWQYLARGLASLRAHGGHHAPLPP